jgi:hypothetical protein
MEVHQWIQFFIKEYSKRYFFPITAQFHEEAIKSSAKPLPSNLFKGTREDIGWVLYSLR